MFLSIKSIPEIRDLNKPERKQVWKHIWFSPTSGILWLVGFAIPASFLIGYIAKGWPGTFSQKLKVSLIVGVIWGTTVGVMILNLSVQKAVLFAEDLKRRERSDNKRLKRDRLAPAP